MTADNVVLDLPGVNAFPSYIEALREGYRIGIQKTPPPEEINAIEKDPQAYLQTLNEQKTGTFTAPDGSVHPFVPYENLWLTRGDAFIGGVSFRHELSEFLTAFGGHVGYGIRPLYQGKGYGTLALKLTRQRAKAMGIARLLLTCSPENPASEKIIVKNGGEFLDISAYTYGFSKCTKRYWVDTRNA